MAGRLKQRKEVEASRLEEALTAMARARRRERALPQLIEEALDAEGQGSWTEAPDLVQRIARQCRVTQLPNPQGALKRLLLHLEAGAPRLLEASGPHGGESYLPALFRASHHHRLWIRPPEEWRPSSHSPSRQFSSLVRHLFAAYRVPRFMDSVFFLYGDHDQVEWFYHLGTGNNIRTATGMTVPLTKRMAHLFLQAPDEFNVLWALRWGQVMALEGSPRLARAVLQTWMGRHLRDREEEDWWATVLQWLAAHPMLDAAQVGPIFDYLGARREGGDDRPADRAFSMKGRTPEALLRLVREWHQEVSRSANPGSYQEFRPCGLTAGRWEFGSPPFTEIWTVTELLSARALVEEGRAMRHCVATYCDSVEKGESAIWSMKVDRLGAPERAVTIEVDPVNRGVVQARGKLNRWPHDPERRILELWARQNRLRLEPE